MTDWLSISFEDGVPEKQLELAVETFDNDAEGLVECSTGTGKVLPSSTYTYCYTYIRTCVRMVHVQALSVLFILLARLFSKKKKLYCLHWVVGSVGVVVGGLQKIKPG